MVRHMRQKKLAKRSFTASGHARLLRRAMHWRRCALCTSLPLLSPGPRPYLELHRLLPCLSSAFLSCSPGRAPPLESQQTLPFRPKPAPLAASCIRGTIQSCPHHAVPPRDTGRRQAAPAARPDQRRRGARASVSRGNGRRCSGSLTGV